MIEGPNNHTYYSGCGPPPGDSTITEDSISVVFEFHCGGWEVGEEEGKQENKCPKKAT